MSKFTNFRKSKLLLFMLLALFAGGVSPAWADELTVFDGTNTSERIPINGYYGDTSPDKGEFIIPASSLSTIKGSTITGLKFYANGNTSLTGTFQVFLKEVESTTLSSHSNATGATTVYTGTLAASSNEMSINFSSEYIYGGGNLLVGIYMTAKGSYASYGYAFYGSNTSENTAYYTNGGSYTGTTQFIPKTTIIFEAAVSGPAFKVMDGTTKITSPYDFDFGLTKTGTTKIFILSNPGTIDTPISVDASNANGFSAVVEDNSTSIPAGAEKQLTISVPDATANGSIVVTPTGEGLSPFTFSLSCTIQDPNKVYLDFSDGKMPEGWTSVNTGNSDYYDWTPQTGYIQMSGGSSYKEALTSPKLTFVAGEKVFFDVARYGGASYTPGLTVEFSVDGTNWSTYPGVVISNDNIIYGTWSTQTATIPSEDVKFIRFNGYYLYLRNIYGGQLPLNPTPKDFAYSSVSSNSALLSWTSSASNFNIQYKTSSDDDWTTLENITANPYKLTGLSVETTYEVRIQADHGANGLSDYTDVISFTTKPTPISTYPYTENFNSLSSGQIPSFWDNSEGTTTNDSYKWTYYVTGYDGACVRFDSYDNSNGNTNSLKTRPFSFTEGQTMKLTFMYKNANGGDFSVYASTDGGTTYTTELATGLTGQSTWAEKEITIPASVFGNNVVIVFKGTSNWKSGDAYIYLDDVTVKEASAGPELNVATEPISFGLVSSASKDIVIRNTGAGQMTGVSVNYTATTGADDAITIGSYETTVEGNSQQVVTVSVNSAKAGAFSGTITVTATDQTPAEIAVSGYTLDNTKILETFTSKPNRWTENSSWYSYDANGARAYSTEKTLTTPKITVAADDVLTINARLTYSEGYVKIEGSTDNGATWTAYSKKYDYAAFESQTANYKLFTLDDIDDVVDDKGNRINKIRISGYYCYINLFNGFTYATDPVLALYSNEDCTTAQTSPATKNFGFAAEAQDQKYYIKNTGNGQIDLTAEVPEGFTAEFADAALTERESTALTITMTATEGLHDGTITVTAKNHDNNAELGSFVVNANGAITGNKNNVVLTAFPAGWQNNNWKINSGAARNWSSSSSDLITTTLEVTEGEKLLVEAKKNDDTDDSQLSYSYSTDNGKTWSDAVSLTNSLNTDYKIVAISGVPAGNVLMKFSGTYTYIRQIYGFKAVSEPILTFAAAGTTKNFGMINSATTTDAYTIKNEGSALLDNLSVECNNTNFSITVAGNATSIAANGEVTFTVTLNTSAIGMQEGVVTISGDDVTAKAFNIKGYVVDSSKEYVTFTAAPDRWENSGWTFDSNGATAGYNSNATIISPKVALGTSPSLAISAKLQSNSSSYYVKVEGYNTETSDWTYSKTLSNGENEFNSTDYSVVVISDIPATVNRLRLVGNYVVVNGLTGFTYDDNDPKFGVFSDSEFASKITTGNATNSWGFVSEDKSATYYIKNTGTGTMTLSKTDAPAGFTAELGKNSLGAGESTTLTISMANDAENNEGYHAGDVVLTAKDNADNELGTFIITSSGIVVSSAKDIDFTKLSALPAGWETSNWTVTANTKLSVGGTQGTLTTSYKVSEGESLVIVAKQQYSGYGKLSYRYKTTGDFSASKDITPSSTSYEIKPISDIPAAEEVVVEFTGQYIDIQRIYGYTKVDKPGMALDKTGDYDFGMQTADAEYVITVTNNGTAELTGLTATLATGTDYSVKVSKTTLAVNESATVTVTQKFDASKGLASLSDVLTISADDVAGKTIKLSGKTRDASKWYVDFANGIPSDFVDKGSWTVSSGAANLQSSNESSLTTLPITLAAGEKIQFEAKNPYSGSLNVRYSLNGGISWSEYVDYSNAISTSDFSSHEINLGNTEEVSAIIEFTGRYYIQVDNIYGGTLNNTAPMMKVTKGAAIVKNGGTEEFGQILEESTATYTITNPGYGTLTITSPIATTGVATASVDKTSLTNGEKATLTITMPVEAPYGAKEGAVTVATSLGDFVINYTATTMDPDVLNEQFASGQPAGWYFGGYWEVISQRAENTASGVADLITEQLAVAGTSDVLAFQAARTSSSSDPTFNVYTSQDRVTWTPVDLSSLTLTTSYQDVNISGLAAGDYYVKISGARVKVDNFLGWTKKNNTRDLYVTTTSFPATTTKGNDATITATVTSLIAAETGVYAKLFINDVQEGEAATDQDIALNGTKTFSFTYAIPENKTAQIKVYYSDGIEAFATAENAMKVNYALNETSSEAITTGTFNVTLTRTYNVGWNTVCLPFEVAVSKFGTNAKAYAFTGYEDGALQFSKVTDSELTAGTPYLLYLDEEISGDLSFSDVTVVSEAACVEYNRGKFQGTFAPIAAPGMEGKWGVTAAGKIGIGTSNAFINGFRAYFDLPAGASARIAINEEGDVTFINGITVDEAQKNVYNLNGQRVETLKKGGLYIINGKKQVVK